MAPGGAGKAGLGLRMAGGQGEGTEAENREEDKALLPKRL